MTAPGAAIRGSGRSPGVIDEDQRDLAIGLGLFVLGLALLGVGLLRRGSVLQGTAGVFGVARDGFAFWDLSYGLHLLLEVWRRNRGRS